MGTVATRKPAVSPANAMVPPAEPAGAVKRQRASEEPLADERVTGSRSDHDDQPPLTNRFHQLVAGFARRTLWKLPTKFVCLRALPYLGGHVMKNLLCIP